MVVFVSKRIVLHKISSVVKNIAWHSNCADRLFDILSTEFAFVEDK